MKINLKVVVLFLALVADPVRSSAQGVPATDPDATPQKKWDFSLNLAGYLVPNDRSYASPTFSADRERLHLEARYNYEDQETGSLWAGYNLSVGNKLELEATPMFGAVFGNTTGIAPGYELSLTYKKLALTSDGEYVFDTKNSDDSFLYSWNELVYSPTDWLHAGLVAQRTRAYHTSLDVQRGFSVGVAHKKMDFTVYTFNAGWTDPTIVLNLGLTF
jgi:hypothetical protein